MAVIFDILKKVNVVVHASRRLEKTLPFQVICIIKIAAIILVVFSTVALMENQVDDSLILLLTHPISDDVLVLHNAKKEINVIALLSRNAAIDKNIWKNIGEDVYLVVLLLPKNFFQPTSIYD